MSRPKINRDYVLEYLRLEEHKRQLDVQSRNLAKLIGTMKSEMIDHVQEKCPRSKVKVVNVAGFDLAVEEKPAPVKWAEEFVKACGAAAADALRAAAKLVPKLSVKPTTGAAMKRVDEIKEANRAA